MVLESEELSLPDLLSEERTLLAKERTSLSYIRTGTALVAVGLGALKIFEMNKMVMVLAAIMLAIGFVMIIYHTMWDRRYIHRIHHFEKKIHKLSSGEEVTDESLINNR
ncbi:MAG: hypothetical protein B6U97_03420 [Candidatus Altiarchaeales archaeon ex4484_96]|nr:MAG: hypothetical protein B6U97_03420 [Candidatus Altiarchaeales archaeon ex4484_96]